MNEKIKLLISNENISIEFIDLVLKRLETLGYECAEGDEFLTAFSIQKCDVIRHCSQYFRRSRELFRRQKRPCLPFLCGKRHTGNIPCHAFYCRSVRNPAVFCKARKKIFLKKHRLTAYGKTARYLHTARHPAQTHRVPRPDGQIPISHITGLPFHWYAQRH